MNIIETKRLIIKPLSYPELKLFVGSPAVFSEQTGLNYHSTKIDPELEHAILNDLLSTYPANDQDACYHTLWILVEKGSKRLIGSFCFHGAPDAEGVLEIGYGTEDDCRNRGFMTEAIAAIIPWLREKENVRMVIAKTEMTNIPSVKVLEKNQFQTIQQQGDSVTMRLIM